MRRLPVSLRRDISRDFLTDTCGSSRFDVEGLLCGGSNIAWSDFDAEGIAVSTAAINDTISHLSGEEAFSLHSHSSLHGHRTSSLAIAFQKVSQELDPRLVPPKPKTVKSWVPRILAGRGMSRLLLMAGLGLAAGAAIGAAAYFNEPLLKLFGFMGDLLVKAGAHLGSAIMSLGQCMADHGLLCPIHAFFSLLKNGVKLAGSIGSWGVKMVGKFLISILKGAVQLGAFTFKQMGTALKGGWHAIGKLFGKISMGSIMLAIGLGAKKILAGVGSAALAGVKGIGAATLAGAKGLGKALIGLPGAMMNASKFVLGGVSMGLAHLGKLGEHLGKMGGAAALFIKGVPMFFGNMLSGAGALTMSLGSVLATGPLKAAAAAGAVANGALPPFIKTGLAGTAELAVASGGVLKDVVLGGGHMFLDGMSMVGSGIMHLSKAAWNFSGDVLKGIGPLIVNIFDGSIKLAIHTFQALGKATLAGIEGIGKAFKFGGKMIGKMAVGSFHLMKKIVTNIPWVLKKFVTGMGKLFSGVGSGAVMLGGALHTGMEQFGAMSAKFAKVGFGFVGKAMMGTFKLLRTIIPAAGKGFAKMSATIFGALASGIVKMGGALLGAPGALLKGMGKLGKLGLAGLKGMWAGLQAGAIGLGKGLKGIGAGLKKLGSTDVRWILTGAILLAYAAYMCKHEGWCAPRPKKPGWGAPGTHPQSDIRLSELGEKFLGGTTTRKLKSMVAALRKPGFGQRQKTSSLYSPPEAWTSSAAASPEVATGDLSVFQRGRAASRASSFLRRSRAASFLLFESKAKAGEKMRAPQAQNVHGLVLAEKEEGKQGLMALKSYTETDGVEWKDQVGDMQLVEVDRSPSIASIDLSGSEQWTCSPGKGIFSNGHPDIKLNSPETSVRVQLHDMESGEVHWDKVYFTDTPGLIDSQARSVGFGQMAALMGGSSHVSTETPPGGWVDFKRLCIQPGDPTVHEYELNVTKYPSNVDTLGYDAAMVSSPAQEQNHVGTAHFRLWVVSDPTPPSEKAARKDIEVLNPNGLAWNAAGKVRGASIGGVGTLIAALPPDAGSVFRSAAEERLPLQATRGAWRAQRHCDFVSPRPLRMASAVSGSSSKASHHLRIRRQGELFFAPPEGGRPSLRAQ